MTLERYLMFAIGAVAIITFLWLVFSGSKRKKARRVEPKIGVSSRPAAAVEASPIAKSSELNADPAPAISEDLQMKDRPVLKTEPTSAKPADAEISAKSAENAVADQAGHVAELSDSAAETKAKDSADEAE